MKKKGRGMKAQPSLKSGDHLGDFQVSLMKFENLPHVFREFNTARFHHLNDYQKSEHVNRILLDLIKQAKTPCFLLPAVLDYIEKVNALKIFESYAFLHFELWLNQFSGLSAEDNLMIRGKITGKWIPREALIKLFFRLE